MAGGALHGPRRASAVRAVGGARRAARRCRVGGCRPRSSSSAAACCSGSCPACRTSRCRPTWCSWRSCRRSSTRRRSSPACETCARTCARSRSSRSGLWPRPCAVSRGRALGARASSWASAFTLGAIVSPTDALAPTEVARRVSAPRRVITIIEGESLVNDGFALVLYKTAVTAAVAGTFSLWNASWHLLLNVVGGIAVGLAVGWVVRQVRRRVDDTPTEVAIALLSGYLAYLPAAAIGVSGVLAAVTIGVYMGWYTPQLTTVRDAALGQRVLGDPRLPRQRAALRARRAAAARDRRPARESTDLADHRRGARDAGRDPDCASSGCRSSPTSRAACSAASASAIRTHRGSAPSSSPGRASAARSPSPPRSRSRSICPDRDLIVFLTFVVILVTLVGQGLTLPLLIRALRLPRMSRPEREDAKARIKAAEAALERLEELADEDWVRDDTARADARGVPVPLESLSGALRRQRRRRRRGTLGRLPAAAPRAPRRRAPGRARAAERGHDHRGG